MPAKLYAAGIEGILDDSIAMSGDIRALLVDSSYVLDADFDVTLDDLAGSINGRSASLTGKSFTAGTFDADDTSVTAEAAVPSKAVVIFQHGATDSLARLIAYIDDASSGLPFTPAAGQVVDFIWDDGVDKIFTIKRSSL